MPETTRNSTRIATGEPVLVERIVIGDRPALVYHVPSDKVANGYYPVTIRPTGRVISCQCTDWHRGNQGRPENEPYKCKHIRKVSQVRRMEQERADIMRYARTMALKGRSWTRDEYEIASEDMLDRELMGNLLREGLIVAVVGATSGTVRFRQGSPLTERAGEYRRAA